MYGVWSGGRIQYEQTIILFVECLSSPCMNGATCSDTAGGYICICARSFEGVNCESESLVEYKINHTTLETAVMATDIVVSCSRQLVSIYVTVTYLCFLTVATVGNWSLSTISTQTFLLQLL